MEPKRQLMHVPRQRSWKRLRFIMKGQCAQFAPSTIAAQYLRQPGRPHQPEQQPPKKNDHNRRWRDRWRKSWQPFERRKKDRQKACFEQQDVPLVAKKRAADGEQG